MAPKRPTAPYTLTGIAAAPGLAAGPAVLWIEQAVDIPRERIARPAAEKDRLGAARLAARGDIQRVRRKIAAGVGEAEAAIFDAHLTFLDDAALLKKANAAIDEGWNAEVAWFDAVEHFAVQLDRLPDPTLRARAADVRDVGQRVLAHLIGRTPSVGISPAHPAVLVARDLAPSQMASLDRSLVLAFCLAEGGPTSHTAILARAWGLPAVMGLGLDVLQISHDEVVLVDGIRGEVVINPDERMVQEFQHKRDAAAVQAQAELAAARQPAVTRDGRHVEVVANVGTIEDASVALQFGAEGIGLLRTEFLYLNRSAAPDEDEQVRGYRAVLELMGSRPVVVRTLDAGGDKDLSYLQLPRQPNPFLGWRAIRVSLDRPEWFKAQVRALLRASPGHDLRIMFPMIATLEELRQARTLLDEARREVLAAGHSVAGGVQVGMMVEVPSVVVLADRFAKEVAFFSIGTNDLTQYTLAADRANEKVAHLSDGCHPAVLRQIHRVIEIGHRAGIWVGVCGELAGDPDAVPVLLGLGLDEFSMAPAAIPRAKAIIRRWSLAEARQLAAEVLDLDTARAVRERVRAHGAPVPEGLSALLPPEAIRLSAHARDWRSAVAAAGEALVASGATTPAYTAEMIATVEKMGPYIVLAPGIALPHARPSPAVLRTGLSLVTLAEPVPFGHPQNDPVSLLIAFAAADTKAHVRALSTLAGLLADEQFRAGLLQARDPNGIRRIIESYETGQATSPKARD